jgi:quinol monooxygenase YgiN
MLNPPGMIELHLTLRARPHQIELLVEALQLLVRSVRLEPGCTEARLCTEARDPECLGYVELWESEEALRRTLCSAHFTHLAALMESAAEPPELEFRFIGETRGLEFARQARGGDDDPPDSAAEPASHGGAST